MNRRIQMDINDNVSDTVKIQKDILWGMYLDAHNHARHIETMRSNAVNFVVVIATALIAIITFDQMLNRYDLPLCFILIIIGLMGTAFSASFTEEYFRYTHQVKFFRKELDDSFFEGKAKFTLHQIRDNAEYDFQKVYTFHWLMPITPNSHYFSIVPPLVVLLIGIFLSSWAVSA
jgi:hypothetical protein